MDFKSRCNPPKGNAIRILQSCNQNPADAWMLVTKKTRSHVLVLLHTRQSSGILLKEIDRQSVTLGNIKGDLEPAWRGQFRAVCSY